MKRIDEELIKIVISILLFVISHFINITIIKNVLLIVSYIVISFEIYEKSYDELKNKNFFNENTLMIIATIAAFCIGEYSESVMVILLYSIGEYLSDKAVDNSKEKISELINLSVDEITIEDGKKEKKINTSDAKIGDVYIVKPGEKIALDGVIVEGNSILDTSSLTGESKPKTVKVGDDVLSGTINKEKVIKIKVTSLFENSTSNKMMKFLEDADKREGKTEKFITRFSKIYTPIVVILSIIIVFISNLLGKTINESIYTAVVFLVTSCPCALVLSVPLGYFCGIGSASRKGILIKGSNELEKIGKVKNIALDKTGTVTKGNFAVTKIYSKKIGEESLIELASKIEAYSNHPIAKSIIERYGKEINKKDIKEYTEISGKGVYTEINGTKYYAGNAKLMDEMHIKYEKSNDIGTIVYISNEKEFLGYILIKDEIKNTSKEAIRLLRKENVNKVMMLSGDQEIIVESIAKEVNIQDYKSELLPMDKVSNIEILTKNGITAFVGDGINDAPVLKIADIGISMGEIGSDIAIEASDIVIMNDDLREVSEAIRIGKKTNYVVRENIIFAILIKTIILVMATLGITTIWLAVFADVGVTMLTILNTLRILLKK